MTHSIESVSQADLAERRRQLRQRRRVRFLQAGWRILAVTGFAAGLVWLVTSPNWVLRRPEQIKVEGNQFIPTHRVRSLLAISYPQSLLKLEPKALAADLKTKVPVDDVVVNRQLFPPGLTVQLQERRPVAIALPASVDLRADVQTLVKTTAKVGLLDESGNWIALEKYIAVDQSLKLPALRITGNFDQYRLYWVKLYHEVSHSPVKITGIDWRDPANLILKTELGIVYFGPYGNRFGYQLSLLDKMRKLPSSLNLNQISYIDLRNPSAPTVQMVKI